MVVPSTAFGKWLGGRGMPGRGPARMTLTLLTRAYCHLCDDMRAALAPLIRGRDVALVEVDVDADAALEARYGDLVPVLLLGDAASGTKLCHYRLDRAAVDRALASAGRA